MKQQKDASTGGRPPPKSVSRLTSDRFDLLEVIHDMVRAEVDRLMRNVAIRGKPPDAEPRSQGRGRP